MKKLMTYKRTGSIVMAVVCKNGINYAVTMTTARSDEEVQAELLAEEEPETQPAKIGFDTENAAPALPRETPETVGQSETPEDPEDSGQPGEPETLEALKKTAAELKIPGYALYKDPAKLREAIAVAESQK